jgi:Domain of unknown function (DUF6456)
MHDQHPDRLNPHPKPAEPSAAEMSRMLSSLARKGAALMATAGDPDGPVRAYHLVTPGDARGRRKRDTATTAIERPVHGDLVRYARQRGWLNTDGLERVFRLSESGALALRRGLAPQPAMDNAAHVAVHRQPTVSNGLSPIARLRQRRGSDGQAALTSLQADAAERLAQDFNRGQMQPRVTTNWQQLALGLTADRSSSVRLGIEVTEGVSAAQERLRSALNDAGPEFADVLLDVCCLEVGMETLERRRGWPHRTAKIILALALDRLSRHYGLAATGANRTGRTGQIHHWGTSDFRPQASGSFDHP